MKIIAPIIQFYDHLFQSEEAEVIIKRFNDKEKVLFDSVRSNTIANDLQAAKLLYDGNPSGQAYSKLKQNLLDKLLKIVINFNNDGQDIWLQKTIRFYKDYNAFNILYSNATNKVALKLAKKLLIQAERNYLHHPAMGLAAVLSSSEYSQAKDKKQGSKYWNQYLTNKEYYENGILALHEYSKLLSLTKKKHFNDQLSELAAEAFERTKPLINENNPRAMRFHYQIGYIKYAAISQHKGVIENNLEALEYFNTIKDHFMAAKDTFNMQIIIAYLGLGNYEKATEFLNTETIGVNDTKWLEKISLKTRIYLHLQNYSKALDLIETTINHVIFKQSKPVMQEQFWLYKYYSDLLNFYETGEKVNTRKVRNNMTRLTADKKGLNIPFMIAETITKLQKKGIKAIYDQDEFLRSYLKSHLKNSHNDRAAIFIKFLLSLPDSKYDSEKFYLNLEKTKNQFEENPATLTTRTDNEIIPYENLVHIIMKHHIGISETAKQPVYKIQIGSAASDY